MEFSNREIATGLLIATGVILLIVFPKSRPVFFKGLVDVLKALFQWKLLLLIGLYFGYAIVIVALVSKQNWWDASLLSVTILTILVTSFPIFMSANNYKSGSELVRRTVLDVAGVTALMITYLNLGEFPIWGEIILQLILSPLVVLVAFASRTPEGKKVARFLEIVLGLIAIGLLVATTVTVVSEAKTLDWLHELKAFAVSVWLPMAIIPFVYFAALFMQIELGVMRLRILNNRQHPPLRVRCALVLGFRGSLRYAARFGGLWIPGMSAQRTLRGGLAQMRMYREAVNTRVAEQRARDRQLRERAGESGVDDQGFRLDRREFHETREILNDIWFTQAAIFRNRKTYVDEPYLISPSLLEKLPKEHGIKIVLATNARSWYAWRKTAGDYYFAMGGSKNADAKWQYDGVEAPSEFPSTGRAGWEDTTAEDQSLEWAIPLDRPIPLN